MSVTKITVKESPPSTPTQDHNQDHISNDQQLK